jgi:phage terminase large subunit
MSVEHYSQIIQRTNEYIYIDFNPTNRFWAHDELEARADVEFLKLTYKDNEALPDEIKREFDAIKKKAETSEYWSNYWRVYGLGELGTLGGLVFGNWQTANEIPEYAELIGYGIDFGFSNSPTACVELYKADGCLYVNELLYRKHMSPSEIFAILNGHVDMTALAVGDTSDRMVIKELQKMGWVGLRPAIKMSVIEGIELLKSEEIYITKKSVNLINEFKNYMYKTDRDGNYINEPIKDYDHGIDALRYIFTYEKFSRKLKVL